MRTTPGASLLCASFCFGCLLGCSDTHDPASSEPGDAGGALGDAPSASPDAADGRSPVDAADASVRAEDAGASGPDASAFAQEKTPFTTAAELCAWVNKNRGDYGPHDRWRGLPVSGQYHTNVTWPLALTVDTAVSAAADAEAQRVAAGGAPRGTPIQLNFNKTLWFEGVDTASYQVISRDAPGDWVPAQFTGDFTAGLTIGNPAARMGLYYQDPGGAGPVLTKIGCGAAIAPDGQSRHWVVAFRP